MVGQDILGPESRRTMLVGQRMLMSIAGLYMGSKAMVFLVLGPCFSCVADRRQDLQLEVLFWLL